MSHMSTIVDRLRAAPNKTTREQMETALGVHFVPTGILFDDHIRQNIWKPKHYVRDWMHTLVSNGVAGTHLAVFIQELLNGGLANATEVLRAYAKKYKLPLFRNRGKVSDRYFKDELIATDHVRHFADDVLGMVRIMYAFLMDKTAAVRNFVTAEHIECFAALHRLIDTLRTCGAVTPEVRSNIEKDVSIHNRLFLKLYGNQHCKIKFHHLYHIPEDVAEMGTSTH